MGQARSAQDAPVAIVQRARVAERQRLHVTRRRARHRRRNPRRQPLAPGIDALPRRQFGGFVRRGHVAAGTDPLRQCIGLRVESARIAEPARRAQAHAQAPARAGVQCRARTRRVRAEIVVPGQLQQAPAQRRRLRGIGVHPKHETRAPHLGLRQFQHLPLQRRHALFPVGGQLPRQNHAGNQPQPSKAQGEGAQPAPVRHADPHRAAAKQQQQGQRPRRQPRQPQCRQYARGERGGDADAERGDRLGTHRSWCGKPKTRRRLRMLLHAIAAP